MPFKRIETPQEWPSGEALTLWLSAIGFNFAVSGAPKGPYNLEDGLLAASVEGIERDDLRVLSMLCTWLEVHGEWVNVDRLLRASKTLSARARAFWAGVGQWRGDTRWLRLKKLHRGARVDLLRVGTEFQISRRGEDARFSKGPLRVPAGVLRDRVEDVMTPAQLASRHPVYRARVQMGPGFRADMWAALECEPGLSASELARRVYGSFATAWSVRRDFQLIAESRSQ